MACTAVVEVEAGPAKGLRLTVTGSVSVDVGRDKGMPGCLRDQTISRKHGKCAALAVRKCVPSRLPAHKHC